LLAAWLLPSRLLASRLLASRLLLRRRGIIPLVTPRKREPDYRGDSDNPDKFESLFHKDHPFAATHLAYGG